MITIGARVGRRAASTSWTRATACTKKIIAVMVAWPKRAVIGANTRRAGSCMAPIQPIIDAASAGEYPRVDRYGIRCTVTEFVVKLPTKNAPASVQNTPVRTAAPRATPGTSVAPASVRRARCGLGRRTSAGWGS